MSSSDEFMNFFTEAMKSPAPAGGSGEGVTPEDLVAAREGMRGLFLLFESACQAGFTTEQAMRMVLAMIASSAQ